MNNKKILLLSISALLVLPLSACSKETKEAAPAPTETASSAPVDQHSHARGDGTISTIQGVTLEVESQEISAGKNSNIRFRISRGGDSITDFVTAHEKLLHMVIVRDDLTNYQHLHPELGSDGYFTTSVKFATAGNYRIVTDFTIQEGMTAANYVLGTDIIIKGDVAKPTALPAATNLVTVDGYKVTLSGTMSASEHGMLMATITKNGLPVNFENYLGAFGHLVAIRQGDFAYAHMHPEGHDHDAMGTAAPETMMDSETTTPMETMIEGESLDSTIPTTEADSSMATNMSSMPGMLHFETEFPAGAGMYKMFLQFQVDGKIITAEFVANVA
jgi:hypothetical protein